MTSQKGCGGDYIFVCLSATRMFWIFCFLFSFSLFLNFPYVFWILCFPFSKGLFVNFPGVFWILFFLFSEGLFTNFPYVFWILCFPFSKGLFTNFPYMFWVGHFALLFFSLVCSILLYLFCLRISLSFLLNSVSPLLFFMYSLIKSPHFSFLSITTLPPTEI